MTTVMAGQTPEAPLRENGQAEPLTNMPTLLPQSTSYNKFKPYHATDVTDEDARDTAFKDTAKIYDVQLNEALEYWRQELADWESLTIFPSLPVLEHGQVAGKFVQKQQQHELSRPILCTEHVETLTLVCAAWALIAGSMTGSDDVGFGVAVSRQSTPAVTQASRKAAEKIKALPMRIKRFKHKTVAEHLNKVQQQVSGMMLHNQLDLTQIPMIHPGARRTCMFQTIISIQMGDAHEADDFLINGPEDERRELEEVYDHSLTIQVRVVGDLATVTATFNPSMLQQWIVQKLLIRLEYVMTQLGQASPTQALAQIGLVASSDLEQIWEWNSAVPPSVDRCVHAMIDDVTQIQPTAPAVCAWDGSLTYGELDRLATRLAVQLVHEYDVQPNSNTIIPLCFEKSMWMPVATIAVLKSGNCFLQLDAMLPEQRLKEITRQIKPHLMLSSPRNEALSSRLCSRVLTVAMDFSLEPSTSNVNAGLSHGQVSPESIAYVVFTSGSTGMPKGVTVSHESIATGVHFQNKMLKIDAHSRVYDFASYSFDLSIWCTFTTLAGGGCLCIPSDQDRTNNLAASITAFQANSCAFTPSVARLISPEQVPTMRMILLGGEELQASDVKPWLGKVRILHMYGPSECTPVSMMNDSTSAVLEDILHIGKGLGAVTWIVDPADHNILLPLGCTGELVLEGPLVGPGYLDNVEKTAATFIEDPSWLVQGISKQPGRHNRVYKTGDLVQYNADGSLKFMGRKDAQVKIRGQRVELGEVEYHVQRWVPDISQPTAVVICPQGENPSPILAVFVVQTSRQHKRADEPGTDALEVEILPIHADVEDRLAQNMPRYMVPKVLFSVAHLPMTSAGKKDRRRLCQIGASFSQERLATARAGLAGPKQQPTSEKERCIWTIWAQVLNIPESIIGLGDNFFHLGGDSITAIKAVSEAHKMGIQLSVEDFFRHPTIHDLAKRTLSSAVNGSPKDISPFSLLGDEIEISAFLSEVSHQYNLEPCTILDAYPCTPLQEGLVSLTLQRQGDYMAQHVLEIAPNVVVQRLCEAWEKVACVMPILRTRIVQHNTDSLVQMVLDEQIQWIHTENLDEYLAADKKQPTCLGEPLMRCALVKDESSSTIPKWLVWTLHHALYDGRSMALIMKAITRAYHGESIEEGGRFQTFVKYIQDRDGEKTAEYWQQALGDGQSSSFPTLPSSVHQPTADKVLEYTFPRPKVSNTDITISNLIRAAWALIAGQMTASQDVIFGVTVSGRNAPVKGIHFMASPTFATVPVRVKLDKNQKVSDYLVSVQRQSSDMIPFEQAGLHRIAKMSSGCHKACQFQTLLVIQPLESDIDDGLLGIWRDETQHQEEHNTYSVTFQVYLGVDTLTARINFDTKVIEPWVVNNLLRRLQHVMHQLSDVNRLQQNLAEVDMITPDELDQIWASNKFVPPMIETCLHDIIHQVAVAQPNAPAVCAWDGELTYGDLDRLSARLANRLIDSGIRPGMLVPLCFEKSVWVIVALLGVLKVGSAFVLLDSGLPEYRLQSVAKQIDAKVIVSSKSSHALSLRLVPKAVTVGHDLWSFLDCESDVRACPPCPSSIMYMIFTSGSTGAPNGIHISHQRLSSALYHQESATGLTTKSRVYDFCSYSFDGSIYFIFATLRIGGCLCIPDEHSRRYRLAESMTCLKANFVFLTPSVARLLSPAQVPMLKLLTFGGEALQLADVQPWWGKVEVKHLYGPSECTPVSTCNTCATSIQSILSIGRGYGQLTWVVDPANHDILLPLGSVGELLLEGPLVGDSYLNDEERTAAAFIQDPKWLLEGISGLRGRHGRIYKTGDLVRYNEDGNLMFIRRKDSQVKIRGQRVELGEIEYWIQHYVQEASQAVVEIITPQRDSSSPILAAFLTRKVDASEASTSADVSETEAFLKLPDIQRKIAQHLPGYMVPQTFCFIGKLPMTAAGKTDRRRIREIGASLYSQHEEQQHLASADSADFGPGRPIVESEQPAFALAERIFSMLPPWCQSSSAITRDNADGESGMKFDNVLLHSCGIDSVNLMSLVYFISKKFDVRVNMRLIADPNTTIRLLAMHVSELQARNLNGSNDGPTTTPNTEYSSRPTVDLMTEINHFYSKIAAMQDKSLANANMVIPNPEPDHLSKSDKRLTVLLTGATGFIGNQILRQLLEHGQVGNVIAITRGDTETVAKSRIIDSATKALWWTDFHAEKLQVWPGDLCLHHLGLDAMRWDTLADGKTVDVFIHNGAVVHWGKSYEELKATNLVSTMELLQLAATSGRPKFLYVSGGREKTSHDEQEQDAIQELVVDAIGYSQTKFVAEAVVRRIALRCTDKPANIAIVCPGRVIGTSAEGVPNTDDYMWRLVAACIKVGAYDAETANVWVRMSDAASMASTIIHTALNPAEVSGALKLVIDGMKWVEFWDILRGMGYVLEARSSVGWLNRIRQDIEVEQEAHPLWPVAHMLEPSSSVTYKGVNLKPAISGDTPLILKVAVRRNVEFLAEVGFLPTPVSFCKKQPASRIREAFSRSTRTLHG